MKENLIYKRFNHGFLPVVLVGRNEAALLNLCENGAKILGTITRGSGKMLLWICLPGDFHCGYDMRHQIIWVPKAQPDFVEKLIAGTANWPSKPCCD